MCVGALVLVELSGIKFIFIVSLEIHCNPTKCSWDNYFLYTGSESICLLPIFIYNISMLQFPFSTVGNTDILSDNLSIFQSSFPK